MPNDDTLAIASYRHRLREAARLALELGDRLLEESQSAGSPTKIGLTLLREIETHLEEARHVA